MAEKIGDRQTDKQTDAKNKARIIQISLSRNKERYQYYHHKLTPSNIQHPTWRGIH
jgi:hypothetical protein